MKHAWIPCLLLALGGCGSESEPPPAAEDGTLDEPADIRYWANAGSAVAVYANVHQLFAIADGQSAFPDPACPSVEDDGTTLSVSGGCSESESDGTQWMGSASVERSGNGDLELVVEHFGTRRGEASDTRDGEASLRRIDATHRDFSISLMHVDGARTGIQYEGQVSGDYGARTVFEGSGQVTRNSKLPPSGTVDVSTTAEVLDNDVCSGQPLSGNTTIANEQGETVVVTYDGESDCDSSAAASYSFNGHPRGKITGISCAFHPGSEPTSARPWLAFVAALALTKTARRRRKAPLAGDLANEPAQAPALPNERRK